MQVSMKARNILFQWRAKKTHERLILQSCCLYDKIIVFMIRKVELIAKFVSYNRVLTRYSVN